MMDTLVVESERVDDIPVLLAHMEKMGIQAALDAHFPTHGNWGGISLGYTAVIWLAHILSEGDHRLSWAQAWVAGHLETLRACTGQPVRALDLSDDRLEGLLRALSHDERWQAFEAAYTQGLLRVYDLQPRRVRTDSTSASGYWAVTEGGLFQFGHRKDHAPHAPQVKVMLSTLDPLGMPVAVQVVSGERADDPLYVPAITAVREGLGQGGLLYIGDSKMAALPTRAFLQAGGDYYLCPLPQWQVSQEVLQEYLRPVWEHTQAVTPVERQQADGTSQRIAEGYERAETLTATVQGQVVTWTERRLVVRSLQQAAAGQAGLQARLAKAQGELAALNQHKQGKARFREEAPLRQKAAAILARYRVAGLLQVDYEEIVPAHARRRDPRRPAGGRVEREFQVRVTLQEEAVAQAVRLLGWRVYATTQPHAQLSLEQAVLAYREEYVVERGMARLKGRPLSVAPLYLQHEAHVTGLIRLLVLALRVLTLLEYTVRRRLAIQHDQLTGLYAGNPKRATARPTAEALLRAFQDITLSAVTRGGQTQRHVTPLSCVHHRILELLDFSPSIYASLAADASRPP